MSEKFVISSAQPDITSRGFIKALVSCSAAIILITIAGLTPVQHARSNTVETFSLNLNNVDIHSLIKTVSMRTGKNFVVDPRVKAKVTVVTSGQINEDELYDMFLSVLQVHGYAAVPAGSLIKIVPMATGVQSAVPVLNERVPEQADIGDELINKVIQLDNVPAEQVIESLRPLLSESATLGAEASSNTIIITERAANIERLLQIIRVLDR